MPSPDLEARLAAGRKPTSAWIMSQRWEHLLFLHWKVDAAVIQKRLPTGLTVDTYGGSGWLGIVPFSMRGVRPRFLPAVPKLSHFLELNLRTYVYDQDGRPGVWFFSLDANQALAVTIAQLAFNLPYQHADMHMIDTAGTIIYESTRRDDSVRQRFTYPSSPSEPVASEEGSLEHFLLERYRLFAADQDDALSSGLVHHSPYQASTLEITDYSTRAFSLNGFDEPTRPPDSTLLAEDVNVRIHPMEKLDQRS